MVRKQVFLFYFQLKSGHRYFKSYLNRAPDTFPDIYLDYNIKENPEHLLLNCKKYSLIRNKIKIDKCYEKNENDEKKLLIISQYVRY